MGSATDFVIKNGVLTAYTGTDSSVTIPDGVTAIGNAAFLGNTSLLSVTIPASVTAIGNCAFSECENLASVELQEGLLGIGASAFEDCFRLRSITIPRSVKVIRNRAFKGCRGLANYKGFIIIGNLLCDYCGKNTDVVIPAGVTIIASYAFAESFMVKKVKFQEGVTKIGEGAFWKCKNLRWVTLPQSLTTIGESAFRECCSLTQLVVPKNVAAIGEGAFSFCTRLKAITVEAGNRHFAVDSSSVLMSKDKTTLLYAPTTLSGCYTIPSGIITIGAGAFSNCATLTRMILPQGIEKIGAEAFSGCENLAEINIPESVLMIEPSAFCCCMHLAHIPVAAANPHYCNDEEGVLLNKSHTALLRAPAGLTGFYPIPSGVVVITETAFESAGGLHTLLAPATVSMAEIKLLHNETPRLNILVEDDCGVVYDLDNPENYNIPDEVYGSCKMLEGVKTIANGAFRNRKNLTDITIPASVTHVGMDAFQGCDRLERITVDSANAEFFSDEAGALLWKPAKKYALLRVPQMLCGSYSVPAGVTHIESRAFEDCVHLTDVTIPDSVNSIMMDAFRNCPGLTIRGSHFSAAERYAKYNNIPFVPI